MGKSSLMVRTTRRLNAAGVATAIVDLTGIGVTQVDPWYIGLLTRIKLNLQLTVDVEAWWNARQEVGAPQRFIDFLHYIALTELAAPITIFVDEIDSTLALDFRDDFFAAIRAIYNARANDPLYNRLTFVLLGVATPADLIRDRVRTPFNIGGRIVLQEFSEADTQPLEQGLEASHPGWGAIILARIFYWTNGHPYLTQKLCLAAAQSSRAEWADGDVDELVEQSFFTREARKESNLRFVQDRIRSSPPDEQRRMLKLYRQLFHEKAIPDDDRSQIQNHLELSGLVGVERGKLCIRNRIYRHVFDLNWIRDTTPVNMQLRIASIAGLVTLALVAFIVYKLGNPVTQTAAQADVCIDNFGIGKTNIALAARRAALACLFDRPGYQERAWQLFYNEITPHDQKRLFLSTISEMPKDSQVDRQVVIIIQGVYVTLDNDTPDDLDLMDAMLSALNASQRSEATGLKRQIENWKMARAYAKQGRYAEAIDIYSLVINANTRNTAALYDRALARSKSGRYKEALADFSDMIVIAKTVSPTSTPTLTPTATLVGTNIATVSASADAITAIPPATASVSTVTATAIITSNPPIDVGTARFTSTTLIMQTIADTIRGDAGLLDYLRQPQNQTAATMELIKTLGLSGLIETAVQTPVPPTLIETNVLPPIATSPATDTPELPTITPTNTRTPNQYPSCFVIPSGGVTVRSSPDPQAPVVGSLSGGVVFTPSAKSTNNTSIVWVRASGGWVYAGTSGPRLVSCSGLDGVPVR